MEAAAHGIDGVEGGAKGAGKDAAVLDDVGVAEGVAAAKEFESGGLVFDELGVGMVNP